MRESYSESTVPSGEKLRAAGESCPGKVWLVGAGPSDPGLFTLKGLQALSEAEVVVYDALVGEGIRLMIPESAEAVYVGKRAGSHTLPQQEISALLARKAKEGKRVVRLKGGDPFLFGRGGEEIEVLLREGIPFEVVPGVTSALAVPAYQGIPVTHRDYCSSLHIVTGHKRAGESLNIDFEALVRTQGTLVFLMGVTALGDICRGLLEAGMDPAMPAALLICGTTAAQKKIVATVSTLEEKVKEAGACTPAIIVIGRVCALSEQFGWYEKQPLGGVKILLTRPRERIGDTAAALRREGAEVLEVPTIRTVPVRDSSRIPEVLRNLRSFDWIVFTSSAGVRCFFQAMAGQRLDCRVLSASRFAVVGPGTARELEHYGFYADLMPEVYDVKHLGRALRSACDSARILIPRARNGSPDLIRELGGTEPWYPAPAGSAGKSRAAAGSSSQEDCLASEAGFVAEDGLPSEGFVAEDGLPSKTGLNPETGLPSTDAPASDADPDGKFLYIEDLPVYDTVYEKSRFVDLQEELSSGSIDYVLFTSASTVRGLAAVAPDLDYRGVRAVCIGEQTAAAAKALEMQTFVAREATVESLIQRVKELCRERH